LFIIILFRLYIYIYKSPQEIFDLFIDYLILPTDLLHMNFTYRRILR